MADGQKADQTRPDNEEEKKQAYEADLAKKARGEPVCPQVVPEDKDDTSGDRKLRYTTDEERSACRVESRMLVGLMGAAGIGLLTYGFFATKSAVKNLSREGFQLRQMENLETIRNAINNSEVKWNEGRLELELRNPAASGRATGDSKVFNDAKDNAKKALGYKVTLSW